MVPKYIEAEAIIQPTTNFRLRLPMIEEYKELDKEIKQFDKSFWEQYRNGKAEFIKFGEYLDYIQKQKKDKTLPLIEKMNKPSSEDFQIYTKYKGKIGKYFSLKGQYFRLTLNNPSQGLSSHQSKKALYMLFCYIKEQGHIWKARICNMPYDEIIMEVLEELGELYAQKLGDFMVEAGNSLLPNHYVEMKAEGHFNDSWHSAK